MEPWQVVALIFAILGWSVVVVVLFGIRKIAEVRADMDFWQAEFEEPDKDWHDGGS